MATNEQLDALADDIVHQNDVVYNLKWLVSPDAERLSDFERINQFVRFGFDAVKEIERLRSQLSQEQEHYRNQAAECLEEKHRADNLQKQLVSAREAMAHAASEISKHIEEYHDFDYQPHEVPQELASLRAIDHHLQGSLMEFAYPDETGDTK